MILDEQHKQKIDFFHKEEVVKKYNGKYLTYFLQPKNLRSLAIAILSIALSTATIQYFQYKQINNQQIQKENLVLEQKQKEQNIIDEKINVQFINSISQNDFDNMIQFLRDSREASLTQLNIVQWKAIYVEEASKGEIKINDFSKDVSNAKFDIDEYYAYRIDAFIKLQYAAKRNVFVNTIMPNDTNAYEVMTQHWLPNSKNNNIQIYDTVKEYDKNISKFIINKHNYAEYINDKNKEVELSKQEFIN